MQMFLAGFSALLLQHLNGQAEINAVDVNYMRTGVMAGEVRWRLMAGIIMVIHDKEAPLPCPAEVIVWVSAPCAALPMLQGAEKVMGLGAAWGIRGAGGITGLLHGTGRPGTFLACSALGELVYKNFGPE